ncbi:hypothetical protein A2U01_0070666 [Trifolium medium]|uniref:Uncharacterized protein n=1 Tax=Trifolium medium TaxID=97028 RepID=A0A392SLX4_9FABA|nr:hypothetical protein [Trifolium medium]
MVEVVCFKSGCLCLWPGWDLRVRAFSDLVRRKWVPTVTGRLID